MKPPQIFRYLPILASCPISRNEFGKVGYLTIHESEINEDNQSHRRGGVHTETPGRIWLDSTNDPSMKETNVKGAWTPQNTPVPGTVAWGRGCHDGENPFFYNYEGGIFMASNVANSTRVWNCQIEDPDFAVGPLGDLEHLRYVLILSLSQNRAFSKPCIFATFLSGVPLAKEKLLAKVKLFG